MRRRAGLGGVRSGAVGFGCSQARCPCQGHGTARTAGGCGPSPRWSSSSLQVNCANQECDLM